MRRLPVVSSAQFGAERISMNDDMVENGTFTNCMIATVGVVLPLAIAFSVVTCLLLFLFSEAV